MAAIAVTIVTCGPHEGAMPSWQRPPRAEQRVTRAEVPYDRGHFDVLGSERRGTWSATETRRDFSDESM